MTSITGMTQQDNILSVSQHYVRRLKTLQMRCQRDPTLLSVGHVDILKETGELCTLRGAAEAEVSAVSRQRAGNVKTLQANPQAQTTRDTKAKRNSIALDILYIRTYVHDQQGPGMG